MGGHRDFDIKFQRKPKFKGRVEQLGLKNFVLYYVWIFLFAIKNKNWNYWGKTIDIFPPYWLELPRFSKVKDLWGSLSQFPAPSLPEEEGGGGGDNTSKRLGEGGTNIFKKSVGETKRRTRKYIDVYIYMLCDHLVCIMHCDELISGMSYYL